jgi:hypothetical protein
VLAVAKFSWNQKVAEYKAVSEILKSLKLMLGFIRHFCRQLRNILKMLYCTHFEALGHLSLLILSSPRSSRSSCGREELPPIFHFHLPPKAFQV